MLNRFKLAAIKERIKLFELERRDLLRMLTEQGVNLAWVTERIQTIDTELRFLYRDQEALERPESET